MESIDLPEPFTGMKHVPMGADYMLDAFAGCVSWAAGEPEIVARFEADTGMVIPSPARTPMDAMIDKATGCNSEAQMKQVSLAFMDWVVVNLWGEEHAR